MFARVCVCVCMLMNVSVFQRLMGPDGMSLVNGTGVHGEEFWTEGGVSQVRPSSPQPQAQPQPQPQRQVSEVYSNTLPVRRPAPAKNKTSVGKRSTRRPVKTSQRFCGMTMNEPRRG